MRIPFLILLLFLVIVAVVGTLTIDDPGYLMASYRNWVLETSVWVGVLGILASVAILVGGWEAVNLLFRGGKGMRSLMRQRKRRRARQTTYDGMLYYFLGEWEKAEKLLAREDSLMPFPLIKRLLAARAADRLGDPEKRDRLLELAKGGELDGDEQLAVGLTEAELLGDQQQWGAAIELLNRLREEHPKQIRLLQLLANSLRHAGEWEGLIQLLPVLKKQKVLTPTGYEELAVKAGSESLQAVLRSNHAPGIKINNLLNLWRGLPDDLQRHPELLCIVARLLLLLGADDKAEEMIRKGLAATWHEPLVALYGRVSGGDLDAQRRHAEQWLQQHPNDAALLLALGRITLRLQQWQRAESYFEASLRQAWSEEGMQELLRLALSYGDLDRVKRHSTVWLGEKLPSLPQPSLDGGAKVGGNLVNRKGDPLVIDAVG